jgi:hypothetical protein
MHRGPTGSTRGQSRTARSSTVVLATTPLTSVARTSTRHMSHARADCAASMCAVPSMTPVLPSQLRPGGTVAPALSSPPSRVQVNISGAPCLITGRSGCSGTPGATNTRPWFAAGYASVGGRGGGVGGAGVGGGARRTPSHSCIDVEPKELRTTTWYLRRFTAAKAVPLILPTLRSSIRPGGSTGAMEYDVPDCRPMCMADSGGESGRPATAVALALLYMRNAGASRRQSAERAKAASAPGGSAACPRGAEAARRVHHQRNCDRRK